MKDRRNAKLVKNTFWFALGNFGSKIITLLLVPLYTSVLSTSEYGTIDIIYTTITLAVPILTLSIYDAAFRFVLDREQNRDKTILSNSFFVLFISSLLLILFEPLFSLLYPPIDEYWIFFLIIYVLNAFSTTISYYLKGVGKTRVFAFQGIIHTLFFAASNVILLLIFHFGINGYFISQIIGYISSILVMLFIGKIYRDISYKSIDFGYLKKMLKYCIPLIPASIAWWIMMSIDKYMLLYMCGPEANGLYSVAHKIPTIISTITSFFVGAWQISAIENKKEDDAQEYASNLYEKLAIIGFLFGFLIIILSMPIGYILFANDFFQAWQIVPCLTCSTILSTLSLFIGAQFTAEKRSDLHLKSNIISMVSNIFFNLLFISLFGVVGAAIGTMLSYLATLFYRHYAVKKLFGMKYKPFKIYPSIFLICFASISVPFFTEYYLPISLLAFALFVIIYFSEIKHLCLSFKTMLFKKRRDNYSLF